MIFIPATLCSLKSWSKVLAAILKLLFEQDKSYDEKTEYFSAIKTFWVVLSNEPVI